MFAAPLCEPGTTAWPTTQEAAGRAASRNELRPVGTYRTRIETRPRLTLHMRSHEPLRRRCVTEHVTVVFGRKSFVAGSINAAADPARSRKKRGDCNTFRSASSASLRAVRRGTFGRLGCFAPAVVE